MADYTPTTEEVRGDYAHFQVHTDAAYALGDFSAALAEFDRWLAALRARWDAEQGEPEWEYRIVRRDTVQYSRSRSVAVRALQAGRDVRRRVPLVHIPAGPWLPVEENGENGES